jgi:hypothetical protein
MKDNIEEGGLHEINIKRINIEFKTHRSAIDFDEKFINYCFQKTDSNAISDNHEAARAAAESNANNAS